MNLTGLGPCGSGASMLCHASRSSAISCHGDSAPMHICVRISLRWHPPSSHAGRRARTLPHGRPRTESVPLRNDRPARVTLLALGPLDCFVPSAFAEHSTGNDLLRNVCWVA